MTAGKYCEKGGRKYFSEKGRVFSASIKHFNSAIKPDNVFRTCHVGLHSLLTILRGTYVHLYIERKKGLKGSA